VSVGEEHDLGELAMTSACRSCMDLVADGIVSGSDLESWPLFKRYVTKARFKSPPAGMATTG
jgi:hypothetical protein